MKSLEEKLERNIVVHDIKSVSTVLAASRAEHKRDYATEARTVYATRKLAARCKNWWGKKRETVRR